MSWTVLLIFYMNSDLQSKQASKFLKSFLLFVHFIIFQMLIALSGYLTGYDGCFAFEKPGDKYEGVNYVGMRAVCPKHLCICVEENALQ